MRGDRDAGHAHPHPRRVDPGGAQQRADQGTRGQPEPARRAPSPPRVDVAVAHGSDLARVRVAPAGGRAGRARCVDAGREPVVLVTRFGDSGVGLQLVFWVRDYTEQGLAQSEVLRGDRAALPRGGLALPLAGAPDRAGGASRARRGARQRCEGDAQGARLRHAEEVGLRSRRARTIHEALRSLGYASVADVRQGKFFEVDLRRACPRTRRRQTAEEIARRVLSNPVIESFRVEVEP